MKKRKKTARTCQTRRGCLNSVLMWRRPDQRRRAAAGSGAGIRALPGAQSQGWSLRLPRRRSRRGGDVSAGPSPPPTRDRPGRAPRTSGATSGTRTRHRALGGELALAAEADAPSARPRRSGLALVERLGQASLTQALGVRRALLLGRAVQPCLPAVALLGDPGVDLGLGRLEPAASSVAASSDARTVDPVMSHHPLYLAPTLPPRPSGRRVYASQARTGHAATNRRVMPRTA